MKLPPAEIHDKIKAQFTDAVLEFKPDSVVDPYIKISPERIKDVALYLRYDEKLLFDSLMCLSGVDYKDGGLGAVYHLHSTEHDHKITLKVIVPKDNPRVPSVEAVWKTANWHEREAYDLFGIIFADHPDLRRILMPYDWEGHPLLKDYQVPEFYQGMKVTY
jgi:NADH-quinone oxidoreductase subunit C